MQDPQQNAREPDSVNRSEHARDSDSGDLIISCRGRTLRCGHSAVVMGVLNTTPDSFYDGGRYEHVSDALRRAEEMLAEGARIIDIGGASSRPRGRVYGLGAVPVTTEEELRRVVPVVRAVDRILPEAIISVDTYSPQVARTVLDAGAHMVNDITGLQTGSELATTVASAGAALIVMHAPGLPGVMPHEMVYSDVVGEVHTFLREAVAKAVKVGVNGVIVDPGFGFGKSPQDNLRLINELPELHPLNCPILVGISRKSTIGYVLSEGDEPVPVDERLYGSLGAAAAAFVRGAHIIRTHDVRPTLDMLRGLEAVINAGTEVIA